jgi:hypothetical protein
MRQESFRGVNECDDRHNAASFRAGISLFAGALLTETLVKIRACKNVVGYYFFERLKWKKTLKINKC